MKIKLDAIDPAFSSSKARRTKEVLFDSKLKEENLRHSESGGAGRQ